MPDLHSMAEAARKPRVTGYLVADDGMPRRYLVLDQGRARWVADAAKATTFTTLEEANAARDASPDGFITLPVVSGAWTA